MNGLSPHWQLLAVDPLTPTHSQNVKWQVFRRARYPPKEQTQRRASQHNQSSPGDYSNVVASLSVFLGNN